MHHLCTGGQVVPVNPEKTKRIPVSLDMDTAEKVAVLAKRDRRSVASWLRCCVEDRVASDWKE